MITTRKRFATDQAPKLHGFKLNIQKFITQREDVTSKHLVRVT